MSTIVSFLEKNPAPCAAVAGVAATLIVGGAVAVAVHQLAVAAILPSLPLVGQLAGVFVQLGLFSAPVASPIAAALLAGTATIAVGLVLTALVVAALAVHKIRMQGQPSTAVVKAQQAEPAAPAHLAVQVINALPTIVSEMTLQVDPKSQIDEVQIDSHGGGIPDWEYHFPNLTLWRSVDKTEQGVYSFLLSSVSHEGYEQVEYIQNVSIKVVFPGLTMGSSRPEQQWTSIEIKAFARSEHASREEPLLPKTYTINKQDLLKNKNNFTVELILNSFVRGL